MNPLAMLMLLALLQQQSAAAPTTPPAHPNPARRRNAGPRGSRY
jgi:hypothetical protein